jgi:hypothetical protein
VNSFKTPTRKDDIVFLADALARAVFVGYVIYIAFSYIYIALSNI